MRSTPIEFNLFGSGPWDYSVNMQNIYNYWVNGTERAKPYESVFTIGMRGAGDCTWISANISVICSLYRQYRFPKLKTSPFWRRLSMIRGRF